MKRINGLGTAVWTLVVGTSLFVGGCGDEGMDVEGGDTIDVENRSTEEEATDSVERALSGLEASPEAWLADRYGPEQGKVVLELRSSGESTRQVRYFADHGRREALSWYAFGTDAEPHSTVLRNDSVFFRGPADSAVQQVAWDPSLPIAMPNFRNINDAMRKRYGLKEVGTKEVLGREATGYELRSDPVVSRVWVWEGIMLYGEIDGIPGRNIEPVTVQAVELDLESDVPEEEFSLR